MEIEKNKVPCLDLYHILNFFIQGHILNSDIAFLALPCHRVRDQNREITKTTTPLSHFCLEKKEKLCNVHNVHSSGCACWAIYQPTKYDLLLLYGPFNTKKILALLLPAPQESHLDYNHTTHGIKPLVKKWSLLHLDLETLKTTLSYSPKNIKSSIFVCFSGIFTSSCERINVAGLHFICSLFFKIALPITIALPMVIKSEEKSQSLSKWPFFPLCTKGKIFHN